MDFCVPTYHPQLTAEMSSEIERLQANAIRIIYPFVTYHTILEHNIVEEHRVRRERLVLNFARKSAENLIFSEKWFTKSEAVEYSI